MAVQPPRPRMPPLNALRAFEAAARTGGFTTAAGELNVTPAAVAQQVKALEGWLGCPLFVRMPQGLRLSDRGQAALPSLVRAFDAMGEAVRDLNGAARPGQIEIAALPAIATLWLAPRLASLRIAFPEMSISIAAMEAAPNLYREPYDLALFQVRDDNAAANLVPLGADRITPVCSPRIAPRSGEDPAAWLRRQTLLHDSVWWADWETWLRDASIGGIAATAGPRFSLYSLAVQAAQEGSGVLIGHEALVAPALRDGRLVAPFSLLADTGWHLAALLPDRPSPLVRRLVEWLADRTSDR